MGKMKRKCLAACGSVQRISICNLARLQRGDNGVMMEIDDDDNNFKVHSFMCVRRHTKSHPTNIQNETNHQQHVRPSSIRPQEMSGFDWWGNE